jgi:cell division protein FtsL
LWLAICLAVCAVFAGTLLHYLRMRHEVYRLGYEVADLTEEHSHLLEENRRLKVEAAFQSSAERLEAEALQRLGLRPTEPDQVVQASEHSDR